MGMSITLVGGAAAPEDLFQEMALLMTRKRESLPESGPFLARARGIAVNLLRDHRKRLSRRRVLPLDDAAPEAVASAFEEPADSAWNDRPEALPHCAEQLPERGPALVRRRGAVADRPPGGERILAQRDRHLLFDPVSDAGDDAAAGGGDRGEVGGLKSCRTT